MQARINAHTHAIHHSCKNVGTKTQTILTTSKTKFSYKYSTTGVSLEPAAPMLRRYYLLFRRLIFCAGGGKFKLLLSFLFIKN